MVAPAVAPVVRSVVAPVVASEAPHEVPPKVTPEVKTAVAADHGQASQASGELTALLNLTIGDLLQAVLLKDPERVKRLKVQLEHSLEPMQDSQPQALAAGLPSAGTRPSESRPSHP
jgi:hypothetical protein